MTNLGKYLDIVTQAKQAGGVDYLIKVFEAKAVAEATPAIFRKGFAVGAVVGVGIVGAGLAGKHLWDKRRRNVLVMSNVLPGQAEDPTEASS